MSESNRMPEIDPFNIFGSDYLLKILIKINPESKFLEYKDKNSYYYKRIFKLIKGNKTTLRRIIYAQYDEKHDQFIKFNDYFYYNLVYINGYSRFGISENNITRALENAEKDHIIEHSNKSISTPFNSEQFLFDIVETIKFGNHGGLTHRPTDEFIKIIDPIYKAIGYNVDWNNHQERTHIIHKILSEILINVSTNNVTKRRDLKIRYSNSTDLCIIGKSAKHYPIISEFGKYTKLFFFKKCSLVTHSRSSSITGICPMRDFTKTRIEYVMGGWRKWKEVISDKIPKYPKLYEQSQWLNKDCLQMISTKLHELNKLQNYYLITFGVYTRGNNIFSPDITYQTHVNFVEYHRNPYVNLSQSSVKIKQEDYDDIRKYKKLLLIRIESINGIGIMDFKTVFKVHDIEDIQDNVSHQNFNSFVRERIKLRNKENELPKGAHLIYFNLNKEKHEVKIVDLV